MGHDIRVLAFTSISNTQKVKLKNSVFSFFNILHEIFRVDVNMIFTKKNSANF